MLHAHSVPPPEGDHAATTCLACGANPEVGHQPDCPAAVPDATDLLVETIAPHTQRTWLVSGAKYNLTPDRRQRFAAQMPKLTWVRPVDKPKLPFSTGALVNEIVPLMGIAAGLAAIGYSATATVAVTDCGCADIWRCRCDFPGHPFRNAPPDLWPEYGLVGFTVRYRHSWSLMWLLDVGVGAVWVVEDTITVALAPLSLTRRCLLGWCDTCTGHARSAAAADRAACACPCHHTGEPVPVPLP
jgi:hypothetical protein